MTEPTSDKELAWLRKRAAYWREQCQWLEPHFHGAGIEKLIARADRPTSRDDLEVSESAPTVIPAGKSNPWTEDDPL